MEAIELSKAFDPKTYEERIYGWWMEQKLFAPAPAGAKERAGRFVIVIPPPNVTGVLHMGHGLNNSLQDIEVRYHRMLGEDTLWVPGTDHAGIATQNVVEKALKKRGTNRQAVGREKFLEETWKVTREHHEIIVRQLQRLGSSCDWSRERFTFDEGLSRAVREVFVSLYEKGLIYRGYYLVNWCPSCRTAISDDEVEHEEVRGKMYHYLYPLADGSGTIPIATTRPETMLGDTAVAVHPEDMRYRHLVGKRVALPLTGRTIPIITDPQIDMTFGTGAVKVTPGHDPVDYEIGQRHSLEQINILTQDGKLNDNVPEAYRGLSVQKARAKVVEDIKAAGLFVKEEIHTHQVGHCYRCNSVIEPFLSDQWFVKMKPLADKALKAWEDGKLKFFPQRWENTYANWLRSIRDWCISRQLWWGHRIPVWYCASCGAMTVSREDPPACSKCGSTEIQQDPDVLDTWFSSALWPFSTLGWPEKTPDLARFYPTTALVTAYDIIFFWVARMIMMGLEFMGEVPFRDIYITGLVRDKQGRKMSKSLGNGIDPLELIDQFGADSLKFTLAFMCAQGQDVLFDAESVKLGSRFANKIWNASRYLLMNLEGRTLLDPRSAALTEIDRWIFHRLNDAAVAARAALEGYRFNEAAQAVYEFFWNDFCDWYIEAAKLPLASGDEAEKNRIATLLLALLEESLRLAHPFLPMITEEIYQKLLQAREGERRRSQGWRKPPSQDAAAKPVSIMTRPYPAADPGRVSGPIAARFASLQELVRAVRTIRAEFMIPPDSRIDVSVVAEAGAGTRENFESHRQLIAHLTGSRELTLSSSDAAPFGRSGEGSIAAAGRGFEVFVFIREAIDAPRELARLAKERERAEAERKRAEAKLATASFVERAPREVVEREKEKVAELAR
ncbi:MAG TPA: valine--tRNA ligase, partial [Spirochaetia bacterium]|nr:valine--tRNA ligase [Spirochaetia bacterium]